MKCFFQQIVKLVTVQGTVLILVPKRIYLHMHKVKSVCLPHRTVQRYAGQGKVEIQAQANGADLIARKGVQMISTEDAIYITSPKEIKLIADGSELKINSSGVFATTSGKFKAGQHLFMGGGEVEPLGLSESQYSERLSR